VEPLRISQIGDLPANPPERTLLLASDADYCLACDALRTSLAKDYLAIWVRGKHHFAWLKAFIEHSGAGHFRDVGFAQITPREVLEQTWGLPIPEWLTDELIVTGHVLAVKLPPGTWGSAEAALLDELFGGLGEQFPSKRAGALAEMASAKDTRKTLATDPLRRSAWQHLVKRWSGDGSASWVKDYCGRLLDDPEKLWRVLTTARLLHGYPNQWMEFAQGQMAAPFVSHVPVFALAGMSLHPDGRSMALDQIEPFFRTAGQQRLTRERLMSLVEATSGELKEEFAALEALMDRAQFVIEHADVQAVALRFGQCGEVGQSAFARLQLHVRPPVPSSPDPDSTAAEGWIKWFHAEYLPYRWWQTERGVPDASVEATAGQFSEWYCRDFFQVHSDLNLSAVHALSKWRESILQDSVSLILLVDNLPWFFWDAFERAFAAAGLHRHESSDCFVPLPSLTEFSKPAIISGRWDAAGCDYRKMLEERSVSDWESRPVEYLSGANQLTDMKTVTAPCVILLNYLASDVTLHSDAAAVGTSHADQLNQIYQGLGRVVGEFARRACQNEQDFGLYVITDHGATRILEAEQQTLDAKFSQKLFPNEKFRSASFATGDVIPENLWCLGHRFTNIMAGNSQVHFIPRGHNTVSSGGRAAYSHGGATPEEVIVPCGVFRLQRADWTLPNVRFTNLRMREGKAAFWIKRMSTVGIEIQNLNTVECSLIGVDIVTEMGEVRDFGQIVIPPKSVGSTTVTIYFSANAKDATHLRVELTFRVAEEILVHSIELSVIISSPMSSGPDLHNLLP
jgi:hypothetical protein